MLEVKTPEEVWALIDETFQELDRKEAAALAQAAGRILAEPVTAAEYVPDFDRSSVDGYAVRAADTFGCSDSMPALLVLQGQVRMGEAAEGLVRPGGCMAVPTGGAVPGGADACVMVEYTEDYGDGTIGILKPAAPGANMVFRGDDVKPGQPVLPKGRRLTAQDIGALAAMGVSRVLVAAKPVVGVISTGDELIPVEENPGPGQVRDVNSALLTAELEQAGAAVKNFGIVRDEEAVLEAVVKRALDTCDLVLLSGGSSVGAKDASCRVIGRQGEILLHGIAMKPGKPTILGRADGTGKPIVGLPGHPVAAWFVTRLFVLPILRRLTGQQTEVYPVKARLAETVGANHGRAQYMGVHLERQGGEWAAKPIRSKSGLITSLANADGYFCISRDCEGMAAGAEIEVYLN